MKISTKRVLSILAAFLFFLGAFLVFFNLIQPELKLATEKRSLLASKTNALNQKQQEVDAVKALISQFQSGNIASLEQAVGFALPVGPQTIDALRQIDAIVRLSSVTLNSLNFKTPLIARARPGAQQFLKRIGTVELSMSVSGEYEALKEFVERLQNSVRVANIKTLKYQPTSGTRVTRDTMNITVETYYQEE